jgi:Cu/Ag efflux protein CusF
MKTIGLALSAILLFTVGPIGFTQAQPGATDEGIDAVDVVKVTATVEKIDLDRRKVTLLLDDGKKKTFKVDSRVQNLAQVQVGDHLKMAFTEEILIVVGKSNEQPSAASGGEVAVAPTGDKPGIIMVETSDLSAKILAVDALQGEQEGDEPRSAAGRRDHGHADDRIHGGRHRQVMSRARRNIGSEPRREHP